MHAESAAATNDLSWRAPLLAWNRFWFEPRQGWHLGTTRIAIGCVALLQFASYWFWAPQWLSAQGWFDLETGRYFIGEGLPDMGSEYRWSWLYRWSSPAAVYAACGLGTLASAATLLGIGSRVAPALAWIAMMTLHHRAPWLATPSELLLAAGLFYLIVDTGRTQFSIRPARSDASSSPRTSVTLATRCIQVHFVLWLTLCIASMLQHDVWWNGTAVALLSERGQNWIGAIPRSSWFGQCMTLAMLALPVLALVCWSRPASQAVGFAAIVAYAIAVAVFAGDLLYALALLALATSLLPYSLKPTSGPNSAPPQTP
ncbi:MAG: hypothetical protein ACK5OB_17665 [Pirellula sp.]